MSLEGNLKDFSLLEVIKLVHMGKKTGRLAITHEGKEASIWMRDGLVVFAESPMENGSLLERMVRDRRLSDKQARQALGLKKIQKSQDKGLAQILVSEKYIEEHQLEFSVKSEIVDSIFDVILWRGGDFRLVPDETHEDELAVYPLDPGEIEAEITKREKTWEAVVQKIPSFDMVFTMAPEAADRAAEIRLKPVEWKTLCLLDGLTTAREVGKRLKMSDFKLGKTLFALYSVGLIKPASEETMVATEYFPAEEFNKS